MTMMMAMTTTTPKEAKEKEENGKEKGEQREEGEKKVTTTGSPAWATVQERANFTKGWMLLLFSSASFKQRMYS